VLAPQEEKPTMNSPSLTASMQPVLNRALEPDSDGRASRIRLLDFRTSSMRAFHLSWLAFFLSFVAWFGIAPLMAVVREDLRLTKAQIGNAVIASVAITILPGCWPDGFAIASGRAAPTRPFCWSAPCQSWASAFRIATILSCCFDSRLD
jgi:hypothetical protein